MQIETLVGTISLNGLDNTPWTIRAEQDMPEAGLSFIHLSLRTEKPSTPPKFQAEWTMPQKDMTFRWTTEFPQVCNIPPDWGGPLQSQLASQIPLVTLFNQPGRNRLTIAASEARRAVSLKVGIREEGSLIFCQISLFEIPEAPLDAYDVTIRLDLRDVFYADAIRAVSQWFETMPEYTPASAPEAAFEPIYSTWYSYHQDVYADRMEAECRLAGEYGLKGIIVDDGWQTEDTNRGYAYCGDWEMSKRRFPDMRAHVDAVHRLGMKYLMWYSVPFVGVKSKNSVRFQGKYLCRWDGMGAYVLDPRFPEVREFLIGVYETAMSDWDLDGFKLDFIDSFHLFGDDPAIAENYAGRDCKTVPEGVDRLLSDVLKRLRVRKPDVLIEFRQRYIGPAMRKYGNMFRAGDCPADILSNRMRTLALRLTSGASAVHADMLEWNLNETPESAALQIFAILFAVPQISVKLGDLPESHRNMLRFWMKFAVSHRKTLLQGGLSPLHPELNYPLVYADSSDEQIAAVYQTGLPVRPDCSKKNVYAVNATGSDGVCIVLEKAPVRVEILDCQGNPVSAPKSCAAGYVEFCVPASGLLALKF